MARALQSGQVTPADELRDLLSASEKLVASVRGSGAGVLVLLENMDRLSELWPELAAAGVDLRPEAGRWETLQATVRRNGRRIVKELRPHGGLPALREQHHPDGNAGSWWYLAELTAADDKRRGLRAGLIAASVLVAGAAIYFLFRFLFPVDPNLKAAMDRQSAGELKIQQQSDYAGALVDFQAATEFQPRDVDTWLRLGATQQKLGDQAGMDESFKRARALVASDAELDLARGQIYLTLNMLDEAKAAIDAGLAAEPENALGYYTLSVIYETRGQPREALETLQRAADLAEAQDQTQLTALARYRLAMLMQQMQAQMADPSTPTPTP
jgi:tetratricopeptide (TPR) repeat protein